MKLALGCIVFGNDLWFDRFQSALAKSLMQPNNLPRLRGAGVDVKLILYTMSEDVDRLREIVQRLDLNSVAEVEVHIEQPEIDLAGSSVEKINYRFLDAHVSLCLKEDRRMMLCPPDIFLADGSLSNLVNIQTQSGTCLAGIYLRVAEETFEPALRDSVLPMNCEQLASLALEHLHPTFLDARSELDEVNSYYTGHSIQSLGQGHYAVGFRVPDLMLSNIQESDQIFLRAHRDFRAFGSLWPSKLAGENRLKILTSSDAWFYAKLTPVAYGAGIKRTPAVDAYMHQFHASKIAGCLIYSMTADRDVNLAEVADRIMPLTRLVDGS
jgi:hypothetical protein